MERERIIERRYVPVPVYREPRVYEPRFVDRFRRSRVYRRYGYPYGYGRGGNPGASTAADGVMVIAAGRRTPDIAPSEAPPINAA